MKKIDFIPITLFLISLLPLFPLFHPGMFVGHDSQSHVARLVAFYQSLSEGNIIPRWAENLNMGYGHPILMFLYPLSNYLGSFWHFLGLSFIDSVKLTFGSTYILSGLFMYLLVKELAGKKIGFLVAILYLFAPYRFVDLYVRAALGEHIAFAFMPLVLYSFLKLVKSNDFKYLVLSSVALALLILSHNAIALMFLPFLLLYLVVFIWFFNRTPYTIYRLLIALVLGFSLSAFFWLPAYAEGKYTLRDIVTQNEYASRFPDFISLFYSPWSYGGSDDLSKAIGFTQWLASLLGLVFLFKTKKKDLIFWFVMVTEGYFWLTFLLLNKISLPIWQAISILQKFQFPWRFLSMSVLTSSLLSLSILFLLKKNSHKTIAVILISFITIITTISFWQPKSYLAENDSYFINEYSGSTDTGESSPRWSIRGMEQKPKNHLEIIEGKTDIRELVRKTNLHSYEVTAEEKTRLVDNTVYFPGWEVLVDESKTNIEFQDQNYRGLITFYIPSGEHRVEVRFRETKLRMFADFVSLGSVMVIFGILVAPYAIRRFSHL